MDSLESTTNAATNQDSLVLRYPYTAPDPTEPGTSYYNSQYAGMYVAIDNDSGGYPYPVTHLRDAKLWNSSDNMNGYRRSFPFLEVYKVEFTITKLR